MWKLSKQTRPDATQTVFRIHEDGTYEVKLVIDPEYIKWIEEGNTPEPADEGEV